MSLCHLNGNYLPLADARLSPLDRGFLFGDGAYEVIPVYSRWPFRLDEHLDRLQRTLDALRLPNPHPAAEWAAIIATVIAGNEWNDQSVYLQITRGADSVRKHAFPAQIRPTVFLMSEPLHTPDAAQLETGVGAVSAIDYRWLRCDLKTVSLLANCLLRQMAVDADCAEAVLFRDGFLTEGAASNIFAVRNGVLLAPPKSRLILPGITYDIILELAANRGMPNEVREISEAEVRAADELWMTSSTKEVLPIVTLDGQPIGTGRPGELARRMHGWYQEFKNTVMRHA
ncbi:MAG: D-amino acid aminotransferase [Azoarcus sp.]|jgi:D-alanine transaminase|nr:D-amino acid aminotransferase [Azoarcus sp.]